MSKTARVVWDVVTSRSLAVWLLALVTVMLAVGAVLPNPALLAPADAGDIQQRYPLIYELGARFNSQELAKSWAFASIGIFLVVSTALCSLDRLFARYRFWVKRRTGPVPSSEDGVRKTFDNIDAAALKGHALAWLRKGRWRVQVTDNGALTDVVGKRGEAGFWGSIFFHGILITALLGLIIYYLAGYRARLIFTEGQSYPLQEQRFYRVDKRPVWGFRLPDVEIGLLKQLSFYSSDAPGSATDYVAKFLVTDRSAGKSWEKDVRINDPLIIDGKEFLLVVGGYSLRIAMRDRTGAIVFDNYVTLKKKQGTEDSFRLADADARIEVKLYPDYIIRDGKPTSNSLQLKNPFLHITMLKGARVIAEQVIPFQGEMRAGSYEIAFPDVRRWVEMELVGEPGIGFFFVLLLLGVVGIAVRMLDPEEAFHISIRQDGSRVCMTVMPYSIHFPGLIAEKAGEFVRTMEEKVRRD